MSIYVYIHAIYQKKLHETDRLVSKCSMKNLDEQWSKPTCDIQILCCSWRDPYTGFLKSLYKWVVSFIPYFVPAQLGWNIATHVWWRKLRKNHSFLQMCKTSLTRKLARKSSMFSFKVSKVEEVPHDLAPQTTRNKKNTQKIDNKPENRWSFFDTTPNFMPWTSFNFFPGNIWASVGFPQKWVFFTPLKIKIEAKNHLHWRGKSSEPSTSMTLGSRS